LKDKEPLFTYKLFDPLLVLEGERWRWRWRLCVKGRGEGRA
jgi:hypothetical protein